MEMFLIQIEKKKINSSTARTGTEDVVTRIGPSNIRQHLFASSSSLIPHSPYFSFHLVQGHNDASPSWYGRFHARQRDRADDHSITARSLARQSLVKSRLVSRPSHGLSRSALQIRVASTEASSVSLSVFYFYFYFHF